MYTGRTTGKTLLRVVAAGIRDRLSSMSDKELRMLERRCLSATEANCGWDEFGIAPTVAEMAGSRILNNMQRKQRERKAAKEAKR